jgi:4'-phosphopantetheinyl transferase
MIQIVPAVQHVHVYVTEVTDASEPASLRRYEALLSDDERARLLSLRQERSRHELLIGRALARHALALRGGGPPERWVLAAGAGGRPEVRAPAGGERLAFSIAHAGGVVACAVTEGAELGVDVEPVDDAHASLGIAEHFFAAAEVAALRALPVPARARRFFRYWTLKEAYLKARGLGLAIPLDRFWFVIGDGAGGGGGAGPDVAVAFDRALADDPGRWQFAERTLGGGGGADGGGPERLLAVAVGGGARPLALSVERCVPLRS